MNRCPIKMLEKFLLERGIMPEPERDQIHKTISEEIEEAVEFAKKSPYPNEDEVLDDVFKQACGSF